MQRYHEGRNNELCNWFRQLRYRRSQRTLSEMRAMRWGCLFRWCCKKAWRNRQRNQRINDRGCNRWILNRCIRNNNSLLKIKENDSLLSFSFNIYMFILLLRVSKLHIKDLQRLKLHLQRFWQRRCFWLRLLHNRAFRDYSEQRFHRFR